MEGKRLHSSSQPLDFLRKIRELTLSIVKHLGSGKLPVVVIDRFRNYCSDTSGNCCCSYDLSIGKEILTLQRECHARRLDVLLRVLLIIQQLLQENRHGSKRDIYYMHPAVFKEQAVVDRAINDICILLQCSRHNLNVVSVGNGLVMGWLRFSEAGRKFDCINSPNTEYPVPVHVEDVKDMICVAQYILVVEKESVFQRLANDQFCRKNRCIVITVSFLCFNIFFQSAKSMPFCQGRGYPDVPTRRFLRLLIEKTRLPAYCLVDSDPYGIDILTTYRFGSMQMAYDAKLLRVPEIRWLGVFPSEIEKYHLPQQCLLPMTGEGMMSRSSFSLSFMDHSYFSRSRFPYQIRRESKQCYFAVTCNSHHNGGLKWSYCSKEDSNVRLKHSQYSHSHSCLKSIYHLRSTMELTSKILVTF